MATNTFSSLREMPLRMQPRTSYTQTLRMIQPIRWFGGSLAITGWVKDSGSALISRRVYLKVMPAAAVIAIYESDTSNANNYFFNGLKTLDAGENYAIDVHDKTLVTAAQVKDNLTPV